MNVTAAWRWFRVLLIGLSRSSADAAVTYTITPASIAVPGATYTDPSSVNNNGQTIE